MAANSPRQTGENGRSRAEIEAIIVIESDEEEELGPEELFRQFLSKIEPLVDNNEAVLLREKFATARSDFACSGDFKNSLRRKTAQVHKLNVYIHYNEILRELLENQDGNKTKRVGTEQENRKTNGTPHSIEGERTKSAPRSERTLAGDFENCKQGITKKRTIAADNAIAGPSNRQQNGDSDIEIIDLEDQDFYTSKKSSSKATNKGKVTSTRENNKSKHKAAEASCEGGKEDPETASRARRLKRKKLIAKLEKKLSHFDKEIKRLNRAELSLEEMEHGDSSYLTKCKLEKKCNDIWNKICVLQGRATNTGRVVESGVTCKGTGFPQIDKAVRKFLRKRTTFPDIFDIRHLVDKTKKKYNLRMPPSVLNEIANEIFTDIGNKMQKKRKKDFEYNFGCYLTDDYKPSLDPALNDHQLQHKLDENNKRGHSALDEVFRKFVHLGRLRGMDGYNDANSASSGMESSGKDSDEDPSHQRRKKRKRERTVTEVDSDKASDDDDDSPQKQKKQRTVSEMEESETQNSDIELESSQEASSQQLTSSFIEDENSSFIELELTDDVSVDDDDDSKQQKDDSKQQKDDSKQQKDDSKQQKDDSKQQKDDSKQQKDDSKLQEDDFDLIVEVQAEKKEEQFVPKKVSLAESDSNAVPSKNKVPAEEKTNVTASMESPKVETKTKVLKSLKLRPHKSGKLDSKILELLQKQESKLSSTTSSDRQTHSRIQVPTETKTDKTSPTGNGISVSISSHTVSKTPGSTEHPSNTNGIHVDLSTTPDSGTVISNGSAGSSPGEYESPLQLFRSIRNNLSRTADCTSQNGLGDGVISKKDDCKTEKSNSDFAATPKKSSSLAKLNNNGILLRKKIIEPDIIILSDDED